jgi:hypothetical protein
VSAQITVLVTPTLLWQTSTGMGGDAAIAGQVFRAGTFNDPPPILVENQGSGSVYLGGSAVTTSTGVVLTANNSLTFNPVGNDSVYAVAAANQTVGVMVGRQ